MNEREALVTTVLNGVMSLREAVRNGDADPETIEEVLGKMGALIASMQDEIVTMQSALDQSHVRISQMTKAVTAAYNAGTFAVTAYPSSHHALTSAFKAMEAELSEKLRGKGE